MALPAVAMCLEGAFDDPLPHNAARLRGAELMMAIMGEAGELFRLLFPDPPVPVVPEATAPELTAAPVCTAPSWIDMAAIRAATARDVLERPAIRLDDRTKAEKSADARHARACALAAMKARWAAVEA